MLAMSVLLEASTICRFNTELEERVGMLKRFFNGSLTIVCPAKLSVCDVSGCHVARH
jgi:hypothetical protein